MPLPSDWIRRLGAAAAIALAVACRADDTMSARDSAFIATMIELRALPTAAGDTGARSAVLRRHGFTARSFEAAATELARDPERAVAVWQRIENPAPPPPLAAPGARGSPGGGRAAPPR